MTASLANHVRMPVVLPAAGAVTVGLFILMNHLIDIGDVRPEPERDLPQVQMRFDVDPVDVEPRLRMEAIPDVQAPPPPVRLDIPRGAVDTVPAVESWSLPEVGPIDINAGAGLANIDRTPMPRVRIEPTYPPGPLTRGQEGACTMVFDITPQGTTANVRVLSCTSGGFERASINAISRWRYDPQIRDGQPVMFRGATTQLVYSLGG